MFLFFLILFALVALAVYLIHNGHTSLRTLMKPVARAVRALGENEETQLQSLVREYRDGMKTSIQPALSEIVPKAYQPAKILTGKRESIGIEGNLGGRQFPSKGNYAVSCQFKPPSGWVRGSDLVPRIHFVSTSNEPGILHFNLWYKTSHVGTPFPKTYRKISLIKRLRPESKGIHKTMVFPRISDQRATHQSLFLFILERYTDHDTKDTLKAPIVIFSLEFEFDILPIDLCSRISH